jgi:glycine dehydrogenase subunit 2
MDREALLKKDCREIGEPLAIDISHAGRRALDIQPVDPALPPMERRIPASYRRTKAPRLPELTELQVIRHFTRLSQLNYSIDTHFYPLGSCTMKYNPKVNDQIAGFPRLEKAHPLAPDAMVQGSLQLLYELERTLSTVTGMEALTLQPAAGAHGELTGVMVAQAYHKSRGEAGRRTKVIVPDSAHGTNPASAALAGLTVIQIKSDAKGRVDLNELKVHLDETCALVMITVPNTLGLFEDNIQEVARIVHAKGALLYMDGANFNALAGLVRPADLGFDIMHLNLHKTFSTPHGGGGPGAGPVGIRKALERFLPVPRVVKKGEQYALSYDWPDTIGRIGGFNGNMGILVRAYAYARALGPEGIRTVSERAIINANYIRVKLSKLFKTVTDEPCMHEAVFSGLPILSGGVKTLDIAKRLLDYGFYAPTIYFPLIVPECLMIEPTETETRETLDSFVRALESIADEIKKDPEFVKGAPYTTPVRRPDEVRAAREPVLRWPSTES